MGTTTNYGWTYPDDGEDADTWGAILTTMFGDVDTTVHDVDVKATRAAQTGDLKFSLRGTTHAGWVKLSGGTIGNASSGASERANADTSDLFVFLWDNFSDSICPVFNSSGIAVTRGATAAEDYAANRRITLHDARGWFPRVWDDGRGVDTGREIGTIQAGQMPSHTHDEVGGALGGAFGGATASFMTNAFSVNGAVKATSAAGGSDNGGEVRPPNISFAMYVKL